MKLFGTLLITQLCLTLASNPPLASGPWGDRLPVAPNEAMVVSGAARFTVLTDRLIRMEYAASSTNPVFEDRATVAFINRNLGDNIPSFTQNIADGVLTITTSSIQLNYTVGSEFSSDTLTIRSVDDSSSFDSWSYGQVSKGNLFGTIRTLDSQGQPPLNCTLIDIELNNKCGWRKNDKTDCNCEWGLVSTEGWAVVDDSINYALSDSADFWDGPNIDAVDSYMFAHGFDYKGALNDYVKVGGSIAMLPRNALGVWWTRWYDFTQQTALDSVEDFRSRSIPLDILVLDMNWHKKNDWTGYSFDDRLYPQAADFFSELHAYGLQTGGNIHDADGVGNFETQFEDMCLDLGLDPTTTTLIPFNISDYASQMALEDDVMLPLEETGFDFWWIDWQQGENTYGAEGGKMNPTIWTAHMRSTDKQRRDSEDRAMVLSRWGGLGGHRYQVGFSGDVEIRWNSRNWLDLAYQPYFSTTASNVGYGYWSHDIVGPPLDMELYTRWLQWGSFSSVMRNHDRGMSAGELCSEVGDPNVCAVVQPWKAGDEYFVSMRNAMRARGALLPYLYTSHRQSYDTGVGIMRPMYYEFPEEYMAYLQSRTMPQYFLGDDLVVSPIVVPMQKDTKLAVQPLWVPPGNWVERTTGLLRTGVSSSSMKGSHRDNKPSIKGKPETSTCPSPSPDVQMFDCATNSFYNQEQCEARGCCWNGDSKTAAEVGVPLCFFSDEIKAQMVFKFADLEEVPVLVKSGSILVEFPDSLNGGYSSQQYAYDSNNLIGRASRPYDTLSLSIFATGATGGSTSIYEDDGSSIAYVNASSLSTDVSWSLTTSSGDDDGTNSGGLLTVQVGAAQGSGFEEALSSRNYEIRIVNSPPPIEDTMVITNNDQDGNEKSQLRSSAKAGKVQSVTMVKPKHGYLMIPRRRALSKKFENDDGFPYSWYYDGSTATTIIVMSDQPTSASFSVSFKVSQPSATFVSAYTLAVPTSSLAKVSSSSTDESAMLSGVRGTLRRAVLAKEVLNEARMCPGETTGEQNEGSLQRLASTSSVLTHAAMNFEYDSFWSTVSNIPTALNDAIAELSHMNATAHEIGAWRIVQATAYLQAAADELQL